MRSDNSLDSVDKASQHSKHTTSADNSNAVTAAALPNEPAIEKQEAGRHARFPSGAGVETAKFEEKGDEEPIILTAEDCYEELGFCFPTWKKWTIVTGTEKNLPLISSPTGCLLP